jgi:hypothetical protein
MGSAKLANYACTVLQFPDADPPLEMDLWPRRPHIA